MIDVQVFFEGKDLPKYQTPQSAGCDVCAVLDTGLYSVTIDPGEIKLIKAGLLVAIPEGYEIQVRPRSGLAAKHGITVLNTPGTIE